MFGEVQAKLVESIIPVRIFPPLTVRVFVFTSKAAVPPADKKLGGRGPLVAEASEEPEVSVPCELLNNHLFKNKSESFISFGLAPYPELITIQFR